MSRMPNAGRERHMMSIKAVFLITYAIIVFGVAIIGILSVMMSRNDKLLNAKTEQRYQSYLLADQLRQSSDDLTRLARTYVVTGDARYENMYWHVLRIRNGESPRPEDYDRIYWDLVLDVGDEPRPAGTAVALHELMREAGFTEYEFARLREAQNNSDGLVNTETIAMNAMKGLYADSNGNYTIKRAPDPEMARRIMHDSQYHKDKASIMSPIDTFFASLHERTQSEVQRYVDRGNQLMLMIQVVAALLVVLSAGIGIGVSRRILRQVGGEPAHIMKIAQQVAQGDLYTELTTEATKGEGISAALHDMSADLREQIKEITDGVDVLVTAAGSISTSAEQLAASAAETSTSVTETSTTLEELRQTSRLANQKAQDVSQKAQESTLIAQRGHDSTKEVEQGMVRIRKQMTTIAARIVELSEQGKAIGGIISTVGELADQSNLLSVNAAIEAALAGEQGKGFAVVAREIKNMAEQSKQAATRIQRILTSIQKATEAAVLATESGTAAVETGAKQVAEAGESIPLLAGNIEDAADAMSQIVVSSREQTEGMDQIAGAMRNIQQATLHSVESSNQLGMSARNLQNLSNRMKKLVDRYTV